MVFFYQFANGLTELYPELYESDGTSTQHQINFGKKWKGYSSIFDLANGDIQKIDEVTELPLEQCLLFLSYKADKQTLENILHREAMRSKG
jgi:hypothetical protein